MTQTPLPTIGQEPIEVDKPSNGDLQLWSVTTIIGALDKPALKWWAAGLTADAAIDELEFWQVMLEKRGRSETYKWLRAAHTRKPTTKLSATDLGTIAHKACETYALTGTRPERHFIEHEVALKKDEQPELDVERETDTVEDMLDQFDGWLQRFTPSYQATEVAVYNATYGYAGSADGFMTIDGTRFIFDYKTSRDTYRNGRLITPYADQVALQLAAYRHAEHAAVWRPRRINTFQRRYYLLSPEERALAVPVPEVDTGLVIKLTPESCESYPIRCDEEVHRAFLYVLEAFRWVQETSKTVMRQPLASVDTSTAQV